MTTTRLVDDLARWEIGELTTEQLQELEGEPELAGLHEVHLMLSSFSTTPVPPTDWTTLSSRLPDRPLGPGERIALWWRRPVAIALATGLLSTGTAYAAGVSPVRQGIDWIVDGVTRLLSPSSPDGSEDEQSPDDDSAEGRLEDESRRGLQHGRGGDARSTIGTEADGPGRVDPDGNDADEPDPDGDDDADDHDGDDDDDADDHDDDDDADDHDGDDDDDADDHDDDRVDADQADDADHSDYPAGTDSSDADEPDFGSG